MFHLKLIGRLKKGRPTIEIIILIRYELYVFMIKPMIDFSIVLPV